MQKSLVTISSDVLFQELEGEAVLLNLANEHYYGLDDIGTRIWQLLQEEHNVESVVAQMLAEYDVSEALLRQDIANLIEELTQAELVTVETA